MAMADRMRQRRSMGANMRRMQAMRRHLTQAGPSMAPANGLRGWQGLDQVFADLMKGDFSTKQYERMQEGYTPGGHRGHFKGVGPQAMKLLAQMMVQDAPDTVPTEGLTGPELFQAQMQNAMAGMQPTNYDINPMVQESGGLGWLQQLLGGLTGQVLGELKPPKPQPRDWPLPPGVGPGHMGHGHRGGPIPRDPWTPFGPPGHGPRHYGHRRRPGGRFPLGLPGSYGGLGGR